MDLLTVTAIAQQIGIPESTCRYYARKYALYLPYIGDGRQRRYRPGAVGIFREIAEKSKDGWTATDILSHLGSKYPVNIDNGSNSNEQQQQTVIPQQQLSATQQQLSLPIVFKEILGIYNDVVKASVAKDSKLQQQEELIERQADELRQAEVLLRSKNDAMLEAGQEINRLRKELARVRLPWWKRLFKS